MSEYNVLQFIRLDAKNGFLEINEAFDIDKIRIGFRQYDSSAEKGSRVTNQIDIYLSPFEALKFALSIDKGIIKAKRAKATDDSAVLYESAPGGNDTTYRVIKVLPGNKDYRIMAQQMQGERDEKGLLHPVKGSKVSYVGIPVDGLTLGAFGKELEIAVNSYYQYKSTIWRCNNDKFWNNIEKCCQNLLSRCFNWVKRKKEKESK